MPKYHYRISLRLTHPSQDLDVANTVFGLEATNSWRTGDSRTSRSGDVQAGVHEYSYWSARLIESDSEQLSLSAALKTAVTALNEHKTYLQEFCENGGKSELFVGWFAEQFNVGDEIDWRLSQRLAELRLNLALDLYSSHED